MNHDDLHPRARESVDRLARVQFRLISALICFQLCILLFIAMLGASATGLALNLLLSVAIDAGELLLFRSSRRAHARTVDKLWRYSPFEN